MRKATLIGVMALAALALGAAPALAQHPDFPNGDRDPGNWSGVTVTSDGSACAGGVACDFDSGYDTPWVIGDSWGQGPHTCEGRIDSGSFSHDGTLTISDASWSTSYPSSYWLCNSIQPTGFPWQGEICVHDPTGQAWVRQAMTIEDNGYPMTGVTFGEIEGDPEAQSLRFGYPPSGYGYSPSSYVTTALAVALPGFDLNYQHAAAFSVAGSGTTIQPASQASCGWSELQA